MKTFDSALYELAMEGKISQDEALKNADSANNLRLRFKLTASSSDDEDDSELLLRGQLPSQMAAAKAAVKKADEKAAQQQKSASEDTEESSKTTTNEDADTGGDSVATESDSPEEVTVDQVETEDSVNSLNEIQAAIVAQIDAGKPSEAANATPEPDEPPAGSESSMDASLAAFELSLEEQPLDNFDMPEDEEASDEPQFGMGKIG